MSTAERKEREKEMRRESIVSVAEKMFFSGGFDEVTMDDIARRAELAKGTLYLYFENKEELYFAIVLRGLKIMNASFREAAAGESSGLLKTLAIGRAFHRFSKEHSDYFTAFDYGTSARFKGATCAAAAEIEELSRENMTLVVNSLRAGITDGSVRDDIDPVKTAIFLIEATQSMILLPMGIEKSLGAMGCSHDDLVDFSLEMMRRSVENNGK